MTPINRKFNRNLDGTNENDEFDNNLQVSFGGNCKVKKFNLCETSFRKETD
jgi:hypothetical protein